ncbi:Structural maintenance of chromosomes protein 3 [Recurvomyces mirabilis]|uniref:Structural maintenance of chromosomes protein n=1 Tax=Recurvomyces mirabilis TaxID=574656 RepID=A0AAE0WSL5_9PEZI|nr:Structural maintenance of chromosomes protein 3 [Recurvomyces mirabilis]KAK5156893.1 Structural maintenance of chromosomes protein 3 [Recurvomyces mirabilis]
MFVKQIIIQGFKSYKDQTVVEPFSPAHNVIVGRNGSGKSNFFAAIRFVLSDQYTQMGREDRQQLLHEGHGAAVMSAYVEIIFDNSDGRFPTDTPEVVLRRTIGQKKDEYSLNRKNTTKQEVMNMLETAGFSRSNPYYIVPQGRITQLTNAKDAERLEILKQVAGTTTYDQRRTESMKLMEDTQHKRSRVDETLDHIRGRLEELEEEKEELRAFQERDRERRCLEHCIHRQDQQALQDALDKLEEDREGGNEQTEEDREALDRCQVELEDIETEISDLQTQIKQLSDERTALEDDRKDGAKQKAAVELDVQTMSDNQATSKQVRTQHTADLRSVREQIAQREAELAQIVPQYNDKKLEERALKQQITDAEATLQRLYNKQNRQNQFKNKRDRDQWLRTQIEEINNMLGQRRAVAMGHRENIDELEGQIQQLEKEIADRRQRIENRGDEQQTIAGEVTRAKEERDRLHDERKELWREQAKLDSVIERAKEEHEKAEQFLSRMMDQATSRGLKNVRRIIREHNVQSTYGPLGELFDFNDKYKTAVEVTAGTSLFNYVVDTDETASRLIEIMKKENAGRLTFIPLNRIRVRNVDIPKASDAVHLVTKLKYNPLYDPAFQQVFGKTIVCPNIQVASQYARSHHLTAITPDGDRSDKKGALTGGWHDPKSSRTVAIKREKLAREEYEQHASRKHEVEREIDAIMQRVTKAMSDLQKVEQRRTQLENGYGPQRDELRHIESTLHSKCDELDGKQRQRDTVEENIRIQSEQLAGYENEMNSDFKKALTNDEEQQLETLNVELPDLRKQFNAISSERSGLEGQKTTLELELRDNLRLRLDQLFADDAEDDVSSAGNTDARLKERQRDLKRATQNLSTIQEKLNENEVALEEAQQSLQTAEASRTTKAKQIEDLTCAIRNHQKSVEKGAQKRAALNNRLQEVNTQVRNLGALPDVAFKAPYTAMPANKATNLLHKVQDALKKYSHVNKKAFEQFASFEKQREMLEGRQTEIETSATAINDLIEHLDHKKDEAIERTFRQVSREFARIFERLVPAGKGRLIIQRRTDRATATRVGGAEDESEAEDDHANTGVDSYTGVGISVSFNSKHDDQQRIQQLSGGQKSLCALTLIFAIQASDPAPFYLFDEIDANLDSQYRTAVAEMLRESAKGGQFICTTFRPEMLLVADKCYGVSYLGKASGIDVVSREQALDFVEGQLSGGGGGK